MQKNGMLMALMGEYRRSTMDLKKILNKIPQKIFKEITDHQTTDPDCKSIQTITFHLIQSGYTYANYIGNVIAQNKWFDYENQIESAKEGVSEMDKMLAFTEVSLEKLWNKSNEELENFQIKTRWNVTYDIEQLLEHAIVHILRHRRQIENRLPIQNL